MKVLYFTDAYLPQFVSGSSITTDIECKILIKNNIEVSVLSELKKTPSYFFYKTLIKVFFSKKFYIDKSKGYNLFRVVNSEKKFAELLSDFQPDLVIVHPSAININGKYNIELCKSKNIPVILYILSLQSFWAESKPLTPELVNGLKIMTNSSFMSHEIKKRLSLDYYPDYIYPIVKYNHYKTTMLRSHVLFINPSPQKGLDTVIELAKSTPDIPYIFLEAWYLPSKETLNSIHELDNVTLLKRTENMREIYKLAKIVIAPTPNKENFCIEAWGRIAVEAHVNGIPVIATGKCGFIESVGPGGMLIPPDSPIEMWKNALTKLWYNETEYQKYSAAALLYSQRESIQETTLTAKYLSIIQQYQK